MKIKAKSHAERELPKRPSEPEPLRITTYLERATSIEETRQRERAKCKENYQGT